MKSIFSKAFVYAIIIHVIVFVAIYFGWLGELEGAGGRFCEAARDGLIKQPSNTFSNLGFALFGLLAAYQLTAGIFSKNKNAITVNYSISLFFVVLMISLSPGSMAMHATESILGGYFDLLSMYLVACFMVAYATGRLFLFSPIKYFLVFLILMGVCHVFHFSTFTFPIVEFGGSFIFMVFLFLTFILEFINNYKNKTAKKTSWGYLSAATMLLAFAIWNTGFDSHPWCRPFSFLQAHAAWHILDACAIYFLFRFYVSENDERFALNR